MIKSSFTYNEEFILEAQKKHKSANQLRKPFLIAGIAVIVLLIPIAIFMFSLDAIGMGVSILGFLLVVVGSLCYEKWSVRRSLRRSPYINDEVTITFSDEHFEVSTPISQTSLSWKVFTKAQEFPDGLLLFHGDHIINWIPSASLIRCDIEDLRHFLKSKIQDYQHITN
ncbi:YcxB family protein [Rubritalea sp.]|uniref:YcxB family protein n=1 Tax=Rubritalea sp. TaxID=2109375 RepID=UPI003EF901E5